MTIMTMMMTKVTMRMSVCVTVVALWAFLPSMSSKVSAAQCRDDNDDGLDADNDDDDHDDGLVDDVDDKD